MLSSCLVWMNVDGILFLGGQDTVEANIEQQQYELIACLERSFRELVAGNAALCCHVDRLEQLVLHHRSAFAYQELGQQTRGTDQHVPSSVVPSNTVTYAIGSGSRRQAGTARSNVDTADMVLRKSCCVPRRSEERSETRHVQAEKNVCHADGRDDTWTANSQQNRWQNISDLFGVDAWPDGASVDSQCEYFLPLVWLLLNFINNMLFHFITVWHVGIWYAVMICPYVINGRFI